MSEWHASGLLPERDAYADWAEDDKLGRPYIHAFDKPGCLVPILVSLSDDCTPDAFLHRAEEVTRQAQPQSGSRPCSCLPAAPRPSGASSGTYRHVTALVTEAFLQSLAGDAELRRMVRHVVVGQRLSEAAEDHPPHTHGHEAYEPQDDPKAAERRYGDRTVVIGVIDDAIAFAHRRFRTAGGKSRVEYAWLQECAPGHHSGSQGVACGREHTKDRIDDWLEKCTHAGIVDEDELYRKAGLLDFGRPGPKAAALRLAHGTHVMDLAGGYEPGEADETRPIVCVQLPTAVTADTSGAGLEPHVVAAIEYILDRADRIAARNPDGGKLPVVINFSYGFQAGPHDGTHPIELAIDDIVRRRRDEAPIAVVLPSGNSHLARCHAEVSFKRKEEVVILDWRLPPDDRTSTFLEIWLPPGTEQNRLSVSIAPPGRDFGNPLPEGAAGQNQAVVWKPNNDVLCKLSYQLVPTSERGRFFVAVLPTAFHDAPTELAPSGLWRVKLTNTGLKPKEKVNLWIQRDDTPHGYPTRGRQSFFESARSCFNGECTEVPYERFDPQGRLLTTDNGSSYIRRAGSISAIATGSQPVVVGGFVRKNKKKKDPLARYSSGGPVTPPASGKGRHRHGPDAVAVCDDTEVHWGVLAAGSRSGSVVAMNGTSVAAPQVARWIADQFAAKPRTPNTLPAISVKVQQAVRRRAKGEQPQLPDLPKGGPPPPFVRKGDGPMSLPPIIPLDRYEP